VRIGLVCPYSLDVAGGVQQQVLELAGALRDRGHDARVLAPGVGVDQPDHVTTTGRDVALRWNGAVARVHWGPGAGRVTRDWLTEGAFDLLHVHEPVTPSVTWHAVLGAEVPVVGTAHTAQKSTRVLRLGAATASSRVRDRVDAWTAVSHDAAATFSSYGTARPALVPNGLQVDAFSGAVRANHGKDPVRLLFLGRLEEPRKGLAVALQTFASLTERRPGVVLDVAGPGDLDTVVQSLQPALPPEVLARIRPVGPVDMPAKARLLEQADVLLAPQLGGESFGIVVAEAMAAGAAIVASDLPAFRRLLHEGRCGVVVPRGDVAAWAQAVGELVDDPDRRVQLGREARAAVDHLDWARVTHTLLEVYGRVLA
jgi:phosphatidyl-myo-inositol alpha-mannosyltransferase